MPLEVRAISAKQSRCRVWGESRGQGRKPCWCPRWLQAHSLPESAHRSRTPTFSNPQISNPVTQNPGGTRHCYYQHPQNHLFKKQVILLSKSWNWGVLGNGWTRVLSIQNRFLPCRHLGRLCATFCMVLFGTPAFWKPYLFSWYPFRLCKTNIETANYKCHHYYGLLWDTVD